MGVDFLIFTAFVVYAFGGIEKFGMASGPTFAVLCEVDEW